MTRRPPIAALLLALLLAPAARSEDIPRPEHPEPLAVREHWANLNGSWEFRFDPKDEGRDAKWFEPGAAGFDRKITVPFGWESELSGIHKAEGAPKVAWYRRTFDVPKDFPSDHHVWLRFGAVDEHADFWVNGKHVAEHDGGYTPFEADITDALKKDGPNVVVVRAFDPTDPSHPTGKQVGWYTPTSGIWQTVWLEARPRTRIAGFTIKTEIDPARATITAGLDIRSSFRPGTVTVRSDDPTIRGEGRVGVMTNNSGNLSAMVTVPVDVREPKLWSPDSPHLYDITVELKDEDGKVIDSVKTYFGLRTISRGKLPGEDFERIFLNGKPIYLRGALDQSFNPKGIYTAPTDEFLKKDIELAKSVGTNFLRIHIKPDEPRRLYWADKLGMLIMEDMPNTWRQNATARKAWESTMREVVARDKNHPSIFAWVDFNETWGLGDPPAYKKDKDTQAWVKRMVAETRKLDPTRLVEDNSPCNYDHVEGSDLNSWHFYIDDHAASARHVAEVVRDSHPGSGFNYCPGQAMNSAPLINSEYGSVGAGNGDRDVSWGFRDLTTLLRKYPAIQGYIYTELSDIEWEHNGFYNYDRSPKDFGYGAFVAGMTPADLQGADFVGYDGPPAIVAKVGDLIPVNLFVSHYSDRQEAPTLRWWVVGRDDNGQEFEMEPRERPVEWSPFGVKDQKRIAFRLHSPFVGAVALTLVDKGGKRIAANFVNVVVKSESPAPRVERVDDHHAALRFSPTDFARSHWDERPAKPVAGKASGLGRGSFTYRLRVPEAVAKAKPHEFTLLLEAGSRAGQGKVDWPERPSGEDYPQTDGRKWPSTLELMLNGERVALVDLPDDPADARGVLSHLAKADPGSHGEVVRFSAHLPDRVLAEIAAGRPIELRLAVPADAPRDHAGGLAIYGADTGAYPFDPTIVIETEAELPEDLGVKPDAPVAIDTLASRTVSVLTSGDARGPKPTDWSYTTTDPGPGWDAPGFDDSSWKHGPAGFGAGNPPELAIHTDWSTPSIWLRSTVDLPKLGPDDTLSLHLYHDEDVEVLVNGRPLFSARGYTTTYLDQALDARQRSLFREGKNTIAVRCRQTGGGQGVDVGLRLLKGE